MLRCSYAGKDGQVDLKYEMSIFDNNYNSLTWQDPFNTAAAGSMSLAPDNEFHQLSLTGGYALPYKSRLTGLDIYGPHDPEPELISLIRLIVMYALLHCPRPHWMVKSG